MQKLIVIAIAGAIGTLARYALGGYIQRAFGTGFPWGTVTINLLGCFAFGAVFAAAQERNLISPELRTIILVGFMGAFTTFSTFIAESGQLLADRELLLGFANIALQVIAGLAVFYLGLGLGRVI
jgi:fluoride exporter